MSRMRLLLCLCTLAALAAAAAVFVPHSPDALQHAGAAVGVWAAPGFIVAGALLTIAMFPGTILAAAAGLLFGPVIGVLVALAAQTLGGVAAALAARSGARGAIERMAGQRLHKLSRLSETTGPLGVAAIRCAPGVPATALHYVLGVSRVPVRAAGAGLALGASPRIAAYVLIGGGISHPGSGSALAGLVVLAVTSLMSAAWVLVRRRRFRRALPALP